MRVIDRRDWRDNVEHEKLFLMCIIYIYIYIYIYLCCLIVFPRILENFSICSIYVEDLMAVGVENGIAELHPRKYSVVCKKQSYCGEIEVGVTFIPKVFLNLIYELWAGCFVYYNENSNQHSALYMHLLLLKE